MTMMMLNLLKKTPWHSRGSLRHLSKNNLIKNQTDKKIVFLKYYLNIEYI